MLAYYASPNLSVRAFVGTCSPWCIISNLARIQALLEVISKRQVYKGKIYVNSILCLLYLHISLQLTWVSDHLQVPTPRGVLY